MCVHVFVCTCVRAYVSAQGADILTGEFNNMTMFLCGKLSDLVSHELHVSVCCVSCVQRMPTRILRHSTKQENSCFGSLNSSLIPFGSDQQDWYEDVVTDTEATEYLCFCCGMCLAI